MKKHIIFSTILLLIVGGIVGCDDDDKTKEETSECLKLYGEYLLKENQTIEGTVVYSKDYGVYAIQNEKGMEYLVCPLLDDEFEEENLKVEISGDIYVGNLSEVNPDAIQGLVPIYRFRNYEITKR